MDEHTLKALRGSIRKWESIVSGLGEDLRSVNCSLCIEFPECEGCPVVERTGQDECEGSPYYETWRAKQNFGRDSIEYMQTAMAEVDFLKSLLPENEQ